MAPKLRFVVTGMVLFAALLAAMLPWRAQKFSSPSVGAADLADASSASEAAAWLACSPSAHGISTPSEAPALGEHASEKARTMKIAAMPPTDMLPPPPSAQRLRDEVSENPHLPPPCVMQFAAGWATKMQRAKADEQLADRLVTQAEPWVGDSQAVVPVIQAICLSNTKLLAAAHQTLAQRYEAMRQRAGADVLRLAEPANRRKIETHGAVPMIVELVLMTALLGAPEAASQSKTQVSAETTPSKRPAVAFGAEVGLHGYAGNGLFLSLNPTGHWALDGGFGWAPAGLTGGLRGRYNFLTGRLRPFVALGASHSFGSTRHLNQTRHALATIDVPHSTYVQVQGGVSYVRQGGLFVLGGLGYQRLLGDSNVRVRAGAISKDAFLRESALVGSGLALSISLGYAL